MAKKPKGKGKAKGKGKEKKPEIPEEWIGKSVEELEAFVAELESQLTTSRQNRNRAQVEHGSIQSYYDVTREQIRELDMQIEKKNLEIENLEDDNATELRVYKQKANFIKYCHDNRLREAYGENEQKMKESSNDHDKHIQSIETAKMDTRNALAESEGQHTVEVSDLQQDSKTDLAELKDKLDADVKLFEQKCDVQQVKLQQELDSRRTAELNIADSRKDSHLKDLMGSHQHRCEDMQVYFEGVERQQQIDIEDLEAELRRLKKAAIESEINSNDLKESNERCGNELMACSEKVVTLEFKTRDKEKNATSVRTTNARLSATRKKIQEASVKLKQLQEKFSMVEDERDGLRECMNDATSEACKADLIKNNLLDSKLKDQQEQNAMLEQHLHHIANSAGLDNEKSNIIQSNKQDFIQDNDQELETLNLSIANATKKYNRKLQSCRLDLLKRGISVDEVDTIIVLGEV